MVQNPKNQLLIERHGKNENRNDGKGYTKNKPTGKDGKDRTHESESEFKTIEY